MSAAAPMQVPRHKRQIFLFVIVVLAPAVVLVGLAGRMMYQDRELASRREADQQRTAVGQLRRELDAHLEAVRLQESTD